MTTLYSEQFDATYDDVTNQWLESECGDFRCEFCRNRPERPLPIQQGKEKFQMPMTVQKAVIPVINDALLLSHKGNVDMLIQLIICYGAEHPEVQPLAVRLHHAIYETGEN